MQVYFDQSKHKCTTLSLVLIIWNGCYRWNPPESNLLYCSFESVDTFVTFVMQTFAVFEMISTTTGSWIRSRRGAIESKCLSSSKSSRSLQKLHDKGDDGAHTLDRTEYKLSYVFSGERFYSCQAASAKRYILATKTVLSQRISATAGRLPAKGSICTSRYC